MDIVCELLAFGDVLSAVIVASLLILESVFDVRIITDSGIAFEHHGV